MGLTDFGKFILGVCLAVVIALFGFLARIDRHIASIGDPTWGEAPVFVNELAIKQYDRFWKGSLRIGRKRTGIDFAMILLKTLPAGTNPEALAVKEFELRKIGRATNGRGILFLFVEDTRTLKIEVSYALEGIFPDALVGRLEHAARSFSDSEHLGDFFTEIMVTMGFHFERVKNGTAKDADIDFAFLSEGGVSLSRRYLSGGAGVLGHGYSEAARSGLNGSSPLTDYQPSKSARATVDAYLGSLRAGITDPGLPLLTEGSRMFRIEYLRNPAYQRRTAEFYDRTRGFDVVEQGDLAAALFRPQSPVWPVYLRRQHDGTWHVDEAKAWAYSHLFENGQKAYNKHEDHPYIFAWQKLRQYKKDDVLYFGRAKTPPLLPAGTRLVDEIAIREKAIAEQPKATKPYVDLADLLYFEAYWIRAAADLYDKALAINPNRDDLRWRLVDVTINLGEIDRTLAQLQVLYAHNPYDERLRALYLSMVELYAPESAALSKLRRSKR